MALKQELEKLKIEYAIEKEKNLKLQKIIKDLENKLRWRSGSVVDTIKVAYYENQNKLIFEQLDINPYPKELKCNGIKSGESINYAVSLMDIIAIMSESREKILYLKTSIKPIGGGRLTKKIRINNNKLNWEKLLLLLQGNAKHLLQINKSYAINVYHYSYSEKGFMVLNHELATKENAIIHKIETSKIFNNELYQERLYVAKTAKENISNLKLKEATLKEIYRYINELFVTNS